MLQSRFAVTDFRPRTPSNAPASSGKIPPLVVEGLSGELHHVAQLTAVATSGVNALATPGLAPAPRDLAPYAGVSRSVLTTLLTMPGDAAAGSQDLPRLHEFLWHHSGAQHAYLDFVAECELLGLERAAIVHQRTLSQRWRKACRHALSALDELEALAGANLPENCAQNHPVLRTLLNSAAQGFRPGMDANGALFIPPLPQQRRWPRRSVLQNCRVSIGSKKLHALVRDVSCGGVGLSGIARVVPGDFVSIDMESGRTLEGTVVWFQDQNAGVKLHKLLPPADPLICG